ncbi:MAG: DUF4317 domain-containing protein [Lachnospiraceae bacterium]|nr:DUF4317 domain-containing protein [Lachnospiraceae bacterium]
MNKKDILELKRRLKKNHCTFTRMCGCYVNAEKEILLTLGENFLNLEEEEFYKYLEIAGKTLSGTPGNNLLELQFPPEEEESGGKQQFLMGLKESGLKNKALLDAFYRLIIDNYDYAGNYLILVFHDAYDVMTRTSDNSALDESEEVYEYLLAAVCPVTLSKAALGYLETEHRIGARFRDWVVGAPDAGFVFPAFTDRSTDIHSVLYYTRDAKAPHPEFMESILGCPVRQTATEQRNTFQDIVNSAVPEERRRERVLYDIHETIHDMLEERALCTEPEEDPEPILLTAETIQEVLAASKVPEEVAARIERSYAETFTDTLPVADTLVDNKLLTAGAHQRKEEELMVEVQRLKDELAASKEGGSAFGGSAADGASAGPDDSADSGLSGTESDSSANPELSAGMDGSLDNGCSVVLRVAPEKLPQISSQVIGGQRCIVIPLAEDEHASVNGEEAPF